MMRMIPDINLAAGDINSPGTDGRPNAGQPHFHSSTLSPGTDAKCRTFRYNGRFHRHGMRGDHEIELTDRLACALERPADARIVESHRIRPVEDCQAREGSLDELHELRPSGLFRPEAQLRRSDDRDT